jgi:hypothetical protein
VKPRDLQTPRQSSTLPFRGINTPSLPAQGGQRRFSYFNIQRGNPPSALEGRQRMGRSIPFNSLPIAKHEADEEVWTAIASNAPL